MTFYEDDKRKAARLLFDAIADLETVFKDEFVHGEDIGPACVAIYLGKVVGARHYLAATLGIPVVAETVEVVEAAEPKRALEIVS